MKTGLILGLLLSVFALSFSGTALVLASHLSDNGATVTPVLVRNQSGSTGASVQMPFEFSSQSLINGLYMDDDGLDSDVRESTNHPPFMPGTGQVQMLGCFNNAAASETASCNDDSADDITLPSTGSEVYDFAFDNQARHLWLNMSTPAVASWTVTWKWYDGDSWETLANVQDGSSGFTSSGLRRVTWDFPAVNQWPQSTLNSVNAYWIRAEVTAVTSVDTAPLAQQAWYETGRWWVMVDSIGTDEQIRYDTHLDVNPDPKAFHYFFPHTDGVTASDAASLELGQNYEVIVMGYIDATAPATGTTKKIIYKEDALECTISAAGVISCGLLE